MHLEIVRFNYSPNYTEGRLLVDGEVMCWTLERRWKRNERNVSCIPDGHYECAVWKRPSSGHPALYVHDVPERSGIMFHAGNKPADCKGCVLLGFGRPAPGSLESSAVANAQLLRIVKGHEVVLTVRPTDGACLPQSRPEPQQ